MGPGSGTSESVGLDGGVRRQVRERLEERLTTSGVLLPGADDETLGQLREQVDLVLDRVEQELADAELSDDTGEPGDPDDHDVRVAEDVGRRRAQRGVHPSTSLAAATTLFEVALPILTERLGPAEHDPVEVASVLHRAIMERILPAAVSYVDVLRERVAHSQQEERVRIARDLHDHVAHGIGIGLQQLQLHELDAERGTTGGLRLERAADVLSGTLEQVRMMAADLHRAAGPLPLDDAVRDYLEVASPPVRTSVCSAGPVDRLPGYVKEEAFLILREALRNSLLHAGAGATVLAVELTVGHGRLVAEITDDGRGFEPGERSSGVGLASMHERAEVLDGSLAVDSRPGEGTRVRLVVPLPWGRG